MGEEKAFVKVEFKNNEEWAKMVISLLASKGICAMPTKCKNCKFFDESKALRPGAIWCDYWGTDPDPTDFCIKGEPKEMEVK